MKTKQRNAGFSLVELMVVVAIIGVLATIAVPNYMKFQSKAKQTNAKSELTGIYTAQKTFFTEYTTYHPNLAFIGYVPDGITQVAATQCPQAIGNGIIRLYRVGHTAGGMAANAAVANQTPPCAAVANVFPGAISYETNNRAANVGALAGADVQANAFTAQARGLLNNGTKVDVWTINQDRSLLNTAQGI